MKKKETPLIDIGLLPEKHCPVCGYMYTAPVAVTVICGDTRHTITGKENVVTETIVPPTARGVIICREYVCEADQHRWREVEQFHKGCTYAGVEIIPGCIGPVDVIWRD